MSDWLVGQSTQFPAMSPDSHMLMFHATMMLVCPDVVLPRADGNVPADGTIWVAPSTTVADSGYFKNLLVVLSARILPPVWHVGQ